MQRQSLGSPGREKPILLSQNNVIDDCHREFSISATDLSINNDVDELKPEKPHRFHSQPEKLIHLIPFLLLFCFIILYFSAHDPSPQELAQFHGFKFNKHPEEIIEMEDIDENNKKQLKRSKAFVIRSQRNLQENIIPNTQSQLHRKLKPVHF